MLDFSRRISLLGILGLSACLAGCGRGDGRIDVEGIATWNGKPIESGYIELQPGDGKGQLTGADIIDGKFTISVLPGTGRVTLIAHRQIGMTEPTDRMPEPEPILFQFLPPKFNSSSELTYTVQADNPTLTFDLEGNELSPRNGPTTAEKRRRAKQGGDT